MAFAAHIAKRLTELGSKAEISGREIIVTCEEITNRFKLEKEIEEAFDTYRRTRSSFFDASDWSYTHNTTVEVPLTRLDQDVYRDSDEITFTDERGNTVTVHRVSKNYMFAHFDSTEYERYFTSIVKKRLTRKLNYARSINALFRMPVTASYTARGRRAPPNFKALALERIRSCLTKLAIERHVCYEVANPKPLRSILKLDLPQDSDWLMPRASYEPNLVNYYKVARSSPFASQSFLAYYHILEYYFLRVAEDALHHQLRTQLNQPSFKVNTDGLDRVIALVRKHGSNDDETDMLRKVLQRFVSEDGFIEHVTQLEAEIADKIYSKRRMVFGEQLEISLKEGHALSNAAKALKHIRNAIVHSSDRYKRDECHIPLTESEVTIGEYIPLVKYFAEQVMYGTAVTPGA
ncbi:hypothetical protein [Comamonas sp.]|uniref:hypothetical protein n=1 Tax=Comamonas sp. TaxID=34028 RepID=UPI0012C2D921|nr:hypothetical protein [Comamonas sp.]MPT13162.1 hypothetical protein [Comamonas sp.]